MDTNKDDATERNVDFPDATQFDAAVTELNCLVSQIRPHATREYELCNNEVFNPRNSVNNISYDWMKAVRDLGLFSTHAELVNEAFVPDKEMSDLLRRGREIVDRLYPSPGITPAEIPSLPAQKGAAQ